MLSVDTLQPKYFSFTHKSLLDPSKWYMLVYVQLSQEDKLMPKRTFFPRYVVKTPNFTGLFQLFISIVS